MVNDFGHWTSPLTFVFLHSFFARKDDVSHNKAFFPLRAYDERIARLIGARMVVTDAPSLPGASLLYETKAGNADLRVFRLENVNRGQYSPTHMMRVSSAAEAIADLSAPSFDPERDVTVDSETYSDLVSASSVSVTAQLGPALSIAAESAGHTLLALPIEYSHCLRLDVQEGASARLIPVNLQQTGLLFERKVKARLAYRFGPFDRPECRRADRERADRLRLREALEK